MKVVPLSRTVPYPMSYKPCRNKCNYVIQKHHLAFASLSLSLSLSSFSFSFSLSLMLNHEVCCMSDIRKPWGLTSSISTLLNCVGQALHTKHGWDL